MGSDSYAAFPLRRPAELDWPGRTRPAVGPVELTLAINLAIRGGPTVAPDDQGVVPLGS